MPEGFRKLKTFGRGPGNRTARTLTLQEPKGYMQTDLHVNVNQLLTLLFRTGGYLGVFPARP